MKIYKLVIRIFLIAVTGIVLIGVLLRVDEVRSRAWVEIAAPPDTVWEFITEPEHRASWMESVQSAVQTSGVTGMSNGTMLLSIYQDGYSFHVYEDVVNSARPLGLETVVVDPEGAITVRTQYQLRPLGDEGTRLQVDTLRTLEGFLAPYFAFVVKRTADANVEGNVARLKALVESRT